jgi:uncharacterized membrane protein
MDRPSTSSYLREFRWYRRSRLWVVPSIGVATALLIGAGTLSIDHFVITNGAPFPIFNGAPDTARTILSLIATAIATLTALILTIVAVIIQLATQALSPRAVRTFLQDAHSHLTIGTFVTTFTFALVILQQFDLTYDAGEADTVTSTSVTIAFVLAVLSIGMFISYVDHIVHQARVTSIIDRIGNETRFAIRQQYPLEEDAPEPVVGEIPDREPDLVVHANNSGVILEIAIPRLMRVIERSDVVVVMVPAVGDFIPTGGRLLEVYGDDEINRKALVKTVEIDAERSIMQDVPFGFRLLIDIAERSLSTGINDPTTATQVVDQVHDLLRQLGLRPFPNGWAADDEGVARLFVPQPTWDIYVALAFEEIRHHGAGSLQVVRRIRSAVEDLLRDLAEERHPALHRQIRLLDETAAWAFRSDAEREAARHPDAQGIGSGGGFEPIDGDGGPDRGSDAEPDRGSDAEPDGGPDAEPDGGPDAEPDEGPDAEPDGGPDAEPAGGTGTWKDRSG